MIKPQQPENSRSKRYALVILTIGILCSELDSLSFQDWLSHNEGQKYWKNEKNLVKSQDIIWNVCDCRILNTVPYKQPRNDIFRIMMNVFHKVAAERKWNENVSNTKSLRNTIIMLLYQTKLYIFQHLQWLHVRSGIISTYPQWWKCSIGRFYTSCRSLVCVIDFWVHKQVVLQPLGKFFNSYLFFSATPPSLCVVKKVRIICANDRIWPPLIFSFIWFGVYLHRHMDMSCYSCIDNCCVVDMQYGMVK